MGYIPDPLDGPTPVDPTAAGPVGYRNNVGGPSATRIRLDEEGHPIYGPEIPIEFGLWPREIPTGVLAPGWTHRWLRLECRHEPPHIRAERQDPATESRLQQCHRDVERALAESKRQGRPTRRLIEVLHALGITQHALGFVEEALVSHAKACDVARSFVQIASTAFSPASDLRDAIHVDERTKALLVRCCTGLGETLLAAGDAEPALSPLTASVALSRSLSEKEPKAFEPQLRRSLDGLARALELLGRNDEANAVLHEAAERGSIIPKHDTLIVAEVPLAGRRRVDRAVFRRGLNQKKPYFGKAFAKKVRARVEDAHAEAGDRDAPFSVNVTRIVLRSLEDPEIVRNEPFTTNNQLFFAGISAPRAPFWEPALDFTPAWKEEEAMRTGWVLGVCTNARDVHRMLMNALEPMIRAAEDGDLWLFPPYGSAGGALRPEPERIANAARPLARGAVWQAMAGGRNPQVGQRVAVVARRRLNDLLYNHARKLWRGGASRGLGEVTVVETPGDYGESLPLQEHRVRVGAFMARQVGEPWATDGKVLLARCTSQTSRSDDRLIELGAQLAVYRKQYGEHPRGGEVVDFVEQWLREVVAKRGA